MMAQKIERKMLGPQGVVRLSPDVAVTTGLGVSEGIEDGIAVMLSAWQPVWAATSAGAISKLPVLAGVQALPSSLMRTRRAWGCGDMPRPMARSRT